MGACGLTERQRILAPWCLPPEVLRAEKVVTDPVHGDIHLTQLEIALVDTTAFQRLRRVRQLGNSHLVYPGAVHTRFSHSLGTLRVAQALLEQVRAQQFGLRATEDRLAQWRGQDDTGEVFDKHWGRATVLARLGALLHDLCHLPAGHTLEDDLEFLESHDSNRSRFTGIWREMRPQVRATLKEALDADVAERVDETLFAGGGQLRMALTPLILSKRTAGSEAEYAFCQDLVGNTICADLLDYLQRDHMFAGLPEALGTRFTSAFFVVPEGAGLYEGRLALNILRRNSERTDVVSELLKALRYRYELTERVLAHKTKLAADAMLGEAMERWQWARWYQAGVEDGVVDKAQMPIDTAPETLPGVRASLGTEARRVSRRVAGDLDRELRGMGDDELLSTLTELDPGSYLPETAGLIDQVSSLAQALQDRRLYKVIGQLDAATAPVEKLWREFGDSDSRAELEYSAVRFAGLNGPAVVLWIPQAEMRLKFARVLVQHEGGISPFAEHERASGGRGSDIYDAHARLWRAYAFARPDLAVEAKEDLVAYLGRRMGVRWSRYDYLGPRPSDWPVVVALRRVLPPERRPAAVELLAEHRDAFAGIAARSADDTAKSLRKQVAAACGDLDLLP